MGPHLVSDYAKKHDLLGTAEVIFSSLHIAVFMIVITILFMMLTSCHQIPKWNFFLWNFYSRPERLAPLGIMGDR